MEFSQENVLVLLCFLEQNGITRSLVSLFCADSTAAGRWVWNLGYVVDEPSSLCSIFWAGRSRLSNLVGG
jgi:hypothetical protein